MQSSRPFRQINPSREPNIGRLTDVYHLFAEFKKEIEKSQQQPLFPFLCEENQKAFHQKADTYDQTTDLIKMAKILEELEEFYKDALSIFEKNKNHLNTTQKELGKNLFLGFSNFINYEGEKRSTAMLVKLEQLANRKDDTGDDFDLSQDTIDA